MATTIATPAPVPAVSSSKSMPIPSPSNVFKDGTQDIPIFLRKTYHMIDSCDPAIASWSDDGETFIVKDPIKFETTIIPQFFKHSKFSSFVRQLNFYAFRKIKYADTIRIDPKLEAETANYWRFRHEKFQRGHPEWLSEIKRMNGQKLQQQKTVGTTKVNANAKPGVTEEGETLALKTEVSTLKQRIEDMTKNIDELTSMMRRVAVNTPTAVQHPPLAQSLTKQVPARVLSSPPVAPSAVTSGPTPDQPSLKRKKIETNPLPVPDIAPSDKSMDIDEMLLPPSIPSPLPVTDQRETSGGSELSDDGFVNELFTVFKTDDFEFADSDESVAPPPPQPLPDTSSVKGNRPDPELMDQLSDVLSMLPRNIQEMIVGGLIEAITSPKQVQDNIIAAKALNVSPLRTRTVTSRPIVCS